MCHGESEAKLQGKTPWKSKETPSFNAQNKTAVPGLFAIQAWSLFHSLSRKRLAWSQVSAGFSRLTAKSNPFKLRQQ
jgi:hypothetical protein